MNEDMNMTENNLPQIEANETMEAHAAKHGSFDSRRGRSKACTERK